MTRSQIDLLVLLANAVAANVVTPAGPTQKKIAELLAEINAGSQDVK